jgi:crossover junction endonuclease EME1
MTLDTAFCMETGQVKTGENATDTFAKMLQEVTRITAPIAYGIVRVYPSVQSLVTGFEKGGRDILQAIPKSANKDGAVTDREVGRKVSRRVYNIFMGVDEGSTDI